MPWIRTKHALINLAHVASVAVVENHRMEYDVRAYPSQPEESAYTLARRATRPEAEQLVNLFQGWLSNAGAQAVFDCRAWGLPAPLATPVDGDAYEASLEPGSFDTTLGIER